MAFNSIVSAETCRKSAPFRVGYSPLSQALSAPLQSGIRFLRLSPLPPPSSPFLAVGIPPCGGTSGAYPVVQWGDANGEAAPSSPAGHDATVVDVSNRRTDPHAILAPACQRLWPVQGHGP